MITITITGCGTGGKALIYELTGRQGRRKFVPTYFAFAKDDKENVFWFSVTRDTSPMCFDNTFDFSNPFGEGGECPPSGEVPYVGNVREDGPKGFRIELTTRGQQDGTILFEGRTRSSIQIHFGAAASEGCFMVAGRRKDYARNFANPLKRMLSGGNEAIQVVVEPRVI